MKHEVITQRQVIAWWNVLAAATLLLALLALASFRAPALPEANGLSKLPPPVMVCTDPEPITRWNRMTPAQRSALNDDMLNTNVSNFNTGFCNPITSAPILVDITMTGAPNSPIPANLNNRIPNRWGLRSFNNGREEGSASGNQYCFTFSEELPIEVNSQEHNHFQNNEHIRVKAFDGANMPIILTGMLNGTISNATVSGSGTVDVSFDVKDKRGAGLWWSVSSNGTNVKQVCVEYYRTSPGQGYYGREPFSLFICNSNRCLFDDPFADADPDNPTFGGTPAATVDRLYFSKEIFCVPQAASGKAGNIDVNFHLRVTNNGTGNISNLQLEEDLEDALPGASFVDFISVAFGAGNNPSTNPTFKPEFDGEDAIQIFDGSTGLLGPGQTLSVDLVVEIDPSDFHIYENVINQSFCYGIAPSGSHVSAASDAPTGAPGNTGGVVDGTLMWVPAINLAINAKNMAQPPSLLPGDAELTIEYVIQNTGNTRLDRISMPNELAAQMGSVFKNILSPPVIVNSTATATPVLNGAFNGTAANANLFNGTSGLLDSGQVVIVQVRILTNPNATGAPVPLKNSAAIASRGLFPGGAPLPGCNAGVLLALDNSDSGALPHTQNNSAPGNSGGSDDVTPIRLPALSSALHIAGVDVATSGIAGRFDVIFETIVENVGNVPLSNLHLIDNLSSAGFFGTAFVAVTSAPQIVATGSHGTVSNAAANPGTNAAWNGSGDLLTGGGLLNPGQKFVLRFRVEVRPLAPGAPGMPINQVTANGDGTGPDGSTTTVSDLSDSGYLTENTNFGWPGNMGTHDDPTPFGNCWDLLNDGIACNNLEQVSVNENCIAALIADMVLEGEPSQCSNPDWFPMGNYYDITVTTPFGIPVPDLNPGTPNVYEIDGSYVGQTLFVKIMEVVGKNSCWGQIKIEDKLKPTFNCPATPVLATCNADLSTIPPPVAVDNCTANPTVALVGETVIDNNFCDDGFYRIRRVWKALDQYGNQSATNCEQVIQLNRPAIDFPNDIIWSCHLLAAGYCPNVTQVGHLAMIVFDTDLSDPDIDVPLSLDAAWFCDSGSGVVGNTEGLCMYNVTHSDQVVSACGNTYKIIRTWTVLDWCTNTIITSSNGEDNQQLIIVKDFFAPVITRPPFSVSANVVANPPQPCLSQGFLKPATATDECNSVTIQIITPIGQAVYLNGNPANGGFIPAPGLPIGIHTITYKATDACGNSTTLDVPVTVVDDITPAAVCESVTEVTLSSDGTATVFAETFDDGSHDNCCVQNFAVRRMTDSCNDGHDDTVFGPSVVFCCTDAGGAPVVVVFRVFDCHGNFTDCMVTVNVKDKTGPLLLTCPSTQRITCDVYKTNYETQLTALNGNIAAQNQYLDTQFGTASFSDNCNFTITRLLTISIDQCLEGNITRSWKATDPAGLISGNCQQFIFVDHVSDWVVEFPADITVDCGAPIPPFGVPEIFYNNCEMIGQTFHDEPFTTSGGACFKIERTYRIINWCVLGDVIDQEVAEEPENALGLAFPLCDLDGDLDCDGRTFRDSWRSGPASNRPGAAQANDATNPDTDTDSNPWDGLINYMQIIKFIDTVNPTFPSGCMVPNVDITTNTCVANVALPTPAVMDCSTNTTLTASGTLGTGFNFANVMPGTYTVTYTATDNCNNLTTCQSSFQVRDAKAPNVACEFGIIFPIGNSIPPSVTVWAQDLDNGSTDNCSTTLIYSFSSNTAHQSIVFDCADVGVYPVQMWVTDAAGNQAFCNTQFIVQDNMDNCMDDMLISYGGSISSASGENVNGVTVNLSGESNGMINTGTDGLYQFSDIPSGNDISITPVKDDDPLNGVTTFDLVMISRHILGVQPLASPYQLIAADANHSGSITTYDLVEIRKLILFIFNDFPSNTSWRFVPKNYVFPNPANPFAEPFPELINVNNVNADVLDADFTAIKTGDVNNSASFSGSAIEDRNEKPEWMLLADDREVTAGETFTVAFKSDGFDVSGYQFTLDFNRSALDFVEIVPGLASNLHFGFAKIEEGALTTSWNALGALNSAMTKGEVPFALTFTAKQDGRLRDWLHLNSRFTYAEAYARDGAQLNARLRWNEESADAPMELFQNIPNPFHESTVIPFYLPKPCDARLTLLDLSGKVLKTVEQPFDKGYHEITIRRQELPVNGVIYYRLEAEGQTAVKRAVFIE